MCFYNNTHLMRARCVMPTQCLPAASLRTAICLPAGRMLIRALNPLIYMVLWAIWRAFSVVESIFLPALREGPTGSTGSAGQALGAGGDVVEGQRHSHAGAVRVQYRLCGCEVLVPRLGKVTKDHHCVHRLRGQARWRKEDKKYSPRRPLDVR